MELKFEEIIIKGAARFEVVVDWEHGDADLTTHTSVILEGMDDSILLAWLAKFREAATMIQNARWYGAAFDQEAVESELNMGMEYDKIYESSSTPPNMSIGSVVWFDGCGKRFNVTGY
jgi:hypothetical protein